MRLIGPRCGGAGDRTMTRQSALTRSVVYIAALMAALGVVVHDSFQHATPVETPSSLLADHDLWGSRVRLVGVVSAASVEPRVGGVRFAIRDQRGRRHVVVRYADVIPDEFRDGGLVEVTGSFGGQTFNARPNSLVAFCSRHDRRQHC